jgi:DNA repair protein RadC
VIPIRVDAQPISAVAGDRPVTALAGEEPDAAVLARLLSLVLPHDTAPLARKVIGRFGNLAAALAAPVRELQAVQGLGTHSIAAIKLVHAAAVRLARAQVMGRIVLDNMDRLIAYLTVVLARERIEQFRVLFLDAEHRLVADEAQARGTVNHTPVYPREVVRRAMELRASAIILVHNHPSGDPTPSGPDIEMTKMVTEAAELLGIEVRDHVIVGNGRWVSFRQEELL